LESSSFVCADTSLTATSAAVAAASAASGRIWPGVTPVLCTTVATESRMRFSSAA
jgi:hypothetical protein